MIKILITIKNNNIIFKERKKLSNEHKNLLNTNIINSNELVFSDDYINDNPTLVNNFINELVASEKINTAVVENGNLNLIVTNLFTNNNYVNSIIYKDDVPISYALCEALIKTNIKNVSCYNIQPFMLELLDRHNILVESRNEILFLSNFMLDNNLNQFSSLFYKISLRIEFPLSEQDEEDFQTFCKINKYLKVIDVNKASLQDLEFLVNTLKSTSKKNIKIVIHDNVTDSQIIDFLKKFNKKKSKAYKIYFRLAYSNDYINKNIVKQTNSKILESCGLIIIGIIVCSFSYVFYDNYASMQNNNNIKESISHVIEITDSKQIIEDLNLNKEEEQLKVINDDIASLLIVNPETVGWLKVNNTNIDYPVVQGINNQYYLKHNFNMEEDNNGWVFMDYRNNAFELNDNTIFYAHNRYYSGVMFGTLQNVLRANWYKQEENQIISFRNLYYNYDFQIFSVYKIYKTTDYMSTIFASSEAKVAFFQKLKDRSIYDFGITPNENDKIITLSTCVNGDSRIVVHAVLKNVSNEIKNNTPA